MKWTFSIHFIIIIHRDESALLRAAARHVADQVQVVLSPDTHFLRLLDIHYSHPGAGMHYPDVHEVCGMGVCGMGVWKMWVSTVWLGVY